MYAVYYNVRPLILCRFRKTTTARTFCSAVLSKELKVRTMSLVHNEDLASLMDLLRNSPYIAADAIIVWRWQNHSLCIRIFIHAPCDFIYSYFTEDSAAFRFLGICIDRLNGGQPQSIKN